MRIINKHKIIAAILIFLTAGISSIWQLKAQAHRLPNVLLITIDALRADHLGCYDYKVNASPNIDKLAKEGIMFSQAISQASWTWPSMQSIVTSLYPSTHGVYFWDQDLLASMPTFSQIIKEKGYYTGFISGHGGLTRLNRSFDTFEDSSANTLSLITDKALSWFRENKNQHFFLWLHYMETHNKYYCGLPNDQCTAKNLTKKAIEAYSLKYDEAIMRVDGQLKILLEKLRGLGIYNDTIIIITADHGEEMGEHGHYYTHGGTLWDSLLRVPLILSYPALFKKGKIITQQVQHIDIVPTILEILGIRITHIIDGMSMLSLLNNASKHGPLYAFSEVKENIENAEGCPYISTTEWNYTKFSIRGGGGYKLILTLNNQGGRYEFYNLKSDPKELNNIVDTEKEQFMLLRGKLEDWMNRPRPVVKSLVRPLDEATEGRLRSLGYLQ